MFPTWNLSNRGTSLCCCTFGTWKRGMDGWTCFCNLFYADVDVRFFSIFSEKYSFTALLKTMIFSKEESKDKNNVLVEKSLPKMIRHYATETWTLVVAVVVVVVVVVVVGVAVVLVNLPGTSAMPHLLLYPNWFRCGWKSFGRDNGALYF